MDWILYGLATLGAISVLDRAGSWAETKGWIYWKSRRRDRAGHADVFADVHALYNPGSRHTVQVKQRQESKKRDDQGDDKEKSGERN